MEPTCDKSGKSLCEQNCTDVAEIGGFICSCHHGFKLVKVNISEIQPDILLNSTNETRKGDISTKRHSCEDIDECLSVSLNQCSQKCFNLKGSFKCECSSGFFDSHGDGSICEESNLSTVIMIAYGTEIRQVIFSISKLIRVF